MSINDTWTGGTGDWDVASNWSAVATPGALDIATFDSAADATLSNVEFENIAALVMSRPGAVVDIQGELTIGGSYLNGVSDTISVTAGSLTIDGGGLIAGQFVTSASGTIHLVNQGTYQWNGGGSSQNVDMGRGLNDTFQFSTQFGGTISSFFAGDIISYSGSVNSVVVGDNKVTFNATNGQSYVINFTGGVYNSSNIFVSGNTIESTRVYRRIEDFNGDGVTDILWRNTNGATNIWNSNGAGGFTNEKLNSVAAGWQIAGTGDFNGDGLADILWRSASGATTLWNSNGAGGFVTKSLATVGLTWQIAGTGDFNGDGEADILWWNTNGAVSIWNSNGSGGFTNEPAGAMSSGWRIAGTGDFNGDGEADILWRNTDGAVAIWDSNGAGGFTQHNLGSVATTWQIAGTGDFNGDGFSDILWRNANGAINAWDSNGSGGLVNQKLGSVGLAWQIAGTGDFNGDGESDILWRNTSGAVSIWNSNGSGGFTSLNLGVVANNWQIQGA